ncbi:hypothetical protein E2C01_048117 [Portunus trituberculatus]|uniref:Uncharacterized protein n=1 Tax=Portunus trituberculatus TaxID=210409 RepID=A0A5B7G9B9_PORTR|nr:hypothetical protein [Portunus trituberculatus]
MATGDEWRASAQEQEDEEEEEEEEAALVRFSSSSSLYINLSHLPEPLHSKEVIRRRVSP